MATQESRLQITIDSRQAEQNAKRLDQQMQNLAKTGDSAGNSLNKTSAEIKSNQTALARLINQIDPTIGRLDDLDKKEAQLRQHFKQGILPTDEFNRFQSIIDKNRDAIGRYSTSTLNLGKAERSLAREAQMVTPQLTDIFTSLVGGQDPMLVAIQQGGQLRDVFGGFKPAMQATGRVIGSLVNPLTIGAGLVGAYGLSWYTAEKRIQSFNDTAAKNNNFAGSGSQLLSTANRIGDSTGNYGGADEAVNSLASTGQVAYGQLQQLAQSVTRANEATGESVEKLVGQYTKIMDDPIGALTALNNQYHNINSEQLLNVQQLVQQGHEQEAVNAATTAWAQASDSASEKVENNLLAIQRVSRELRGELSKFWHWIGDSASSAASELAESFGRATQADFLSNARQQLSQGGTLGHLNTNRQGAYLQDLNSNVMGLLGTDPQQQQNASNDAASYLLKVGQQFESTSQRMQRQLTQLDAAWAKYNKGDHSLEERQAYESRYKQARQAIIAQGQTSTRSSTSHAGVSSSAQSDFNRQLIQSREGLAGLIQPYSQVDKAQVEYEHQLANINQQVKQGRINEMEATVARVNAAAQYNKVGDAAGSAARQLEQYKNNLNFQLGLQQQQNGLQVAGVGMGSQELQRQQEILQIRQQSAQRVQQLNDQRNQSGANQDNIDKEIAAEQDAVEKRVTLQRNMYRNLDAMRGDWSAGWSAAWQNYQVDAQNTAAMTQSLFGDAFDQAGDSLATFVKTGKLNFANLTSSVIDDLAKIAAQKGLSSLLSLAGFSFGGPIGATALSSFGSVAGGSNITSGLGGANALLGGSGGNIFSSITSGIGHLFADGGYTGDGSKYQPAGTVHAGEYVVRSEVTKQPGMRNHLDRLNRGYARGGYVGNNSGQSNPLAPYVTVNNYRSNDTNVTAKSDGNGGITIDVIHRESRNALRQSFENDDEVAKTVQRNYRLKRYGW